MDEDVSITPPATRESLPKEALAAVRGAVKPLDWYLRKLDEHRARYTAVGKAEWWWLFEDTLADVAAALSNHSMVWLDGFLLEPQARELREDVLRVREAGFMKSGVLGGGRLGSTLGYVHEKVRGDLMTWMNGDEPEIEWKALPAYGKKVRRC